MSALVRLPRFRYLLFGGGALLLVTLMLLFLGVIPGTTTVAASSCASTVHYYAYDAPSGSDRFGPEITQHAASAGQARLHQKLCSDPLFAATQEAFLTTDVASISSDKVEARARAFVKNRGQWNTAVSALERQFTSYKVVDDPHSFETVAMVPGHSKSVMPTLAKLNTAVPVGFALRVTMADGSTHELRFVCDLQPVAPLIPFKSVTPSKTPPSHQPPPGTTPPTSPPHTTPPSTPPTTPPTTPPGQPKCKPGQWWNGRVCLTPKDPSKDPQSQGNVPTQAVKHTPSPDNASEVAQPPASPVDTGNGIPSGSPPRVTPKPAPTPTPTSSYTLPAPTEPPAPPPTTATATGTIAPPPPPAF